VIADALGVSIVPGDDIGDENATVNSTESLARRTMEKQKTGMTVASDSILARGLHIHLLSER
jgi:hypothetical protein